MGSNIPRTPAQLVDYLLSKTITDPATGCLLWTGAATHLGYGVAYSVHFRTRQAHRLMYLAAIGPLDDDRHLDHLCRRPPCINTEHLEPVTPRTNILRGEGLAAMNARKTHCKWGHPLTADNIWVGVDSTRVCRTCSRLTASGKHPRQLARDGAA